MLKILERMKKIGVMEILVLIQLKKKYFLDLDHL